MVKDHMVKTNVLCSRNIQPRRNLNDWEVEDMGRLLDYLERYNIRNLEREDERLRLLSEEKDSL